MATADDVRLADSLPAIGERKRAAQKVAQALVAERERLEEEWLQRYSRAQGQVNKVEQDEVRAGQANARIRREIPLTVVTARDQAARALREHEVELKRDRDEHEGAVEMLTRKKQRREKVSTVVCDVDGTSKVVVQERELPETPKAELEGLAERAAEKLAARREAEKQHLELEALAKKTQGEVDLELARIRKAALAKAPAK